MRRALDISTPLGPEALTVTEFNGHEALSSLSAFHLVLKSRRPDIAGEEILGQNVTVHLELAGRDVRHFNGHVIRWSGATEVRDSTVGQKDTKAFLYEATVCPWLWFLTRRIDCRIFQDRTVPQIVREVFAASSGPAPAFKMDLRRDYPTWNYCCQYRESDFNFVSRLLEQEGIYYYFEHGDGKHTLVLTDSSSHHRPYPGYDEVRFDEFTRSDRERLAQWSGSSEIQSGRFVVDDYNYRIPKTSMRAARERKREHLYSGAEVYDYPAEYDQLADGPWYADARLDEAQTQYRVFSGSGNVRGLQPGSQFALIRHPNEAFNISLLTVEADYEARANSDVSGGGSGFEFGCAVRAIPFRQQFRPARVTRKPTIAGPQTAVVVGPAGEEIYTADEKHLGCVKVQFRWDRYGQVDQNSSCWVRVVQPWAGKGWGALAIPPIGHEVVVEFLEGDPDRPLVTGSVYNAVNLPPYDLPRHKTRWGLMSRSSKGGGSNNFNELRFDDLKGSEEVYLQAEKDHNVLVKNDRTERVGHNEKIDIGANRRETVGRNESVRIGANRRVVVGANKMETVALAKAETIGAAKALTIGAAYQVSVGGAMNTTVGLGQFAQIGLGKTTLVGKKYSIEAGDELEIKVGQASLVMKSDGTVLINGSKFDFSASGPVQINGKDVDIN